jgi:hypothetical protein
LASASGKGAEVAWDVESDRHYFFFRPPTTRPEREPADRAGRRAIL